MRNYWSSIALALALLVFTWLVGGIAEARGGGRPGGEHEGGEHWGGDHRGGQPDGWDHHWEGHEGHDGWYGYPAPVYPYPDPYVPPAVATPSAGYWNYCASANGYYPYVAQCPEGWKQVVPQSQP